MQMCRFRGWAIGLGLILPGLTLGLAGCNKPPEMPAPPPPTVTVAQPLDREVMEWDEYTGRLEAQHTVEVRAQVSGYMQSVHFKEGGIVNKGDVLFVIDPRSFRAELSRTQGEVERAKARLALAQTEFKRTQSLVPSEAASELELEERKANLAEAQAQLQVAQANARTADINLGYTEIRAEITGRIGEAFVKPGNLVSGGGQAQATLLTRITSLDPIYCYVDADENSVLKYQRLAREKKRPSAQRGAIVPAKMALLDEDDFAHVGHIDFVDNRVDPTTGTLRARGVFPNPGGVMTPGLFGRLRVPGNQPYRTLLVSEAALQSDQSAKYVLTVDAQNTVKVTPVETGALFGSLRAIKSGLTGGERVIVNGILRARPESKVNPQPGEMPGAKDADTLATTRVVEPQVAPTTAPTTREAPALAPGGPEREDRAAKAAPAAAKVMTPLIGVAQEVGR